MQVNTTHAITFRELFIFIKLFSGIGATESNLQILPCLQKILPPPKASLQTLFVLGNTALVGNPIRTIVMGKEYSIISPGKYETIFSATHHYIFLLASPELTADQLVPLFVERYTPLLYDAPKIIDPVLQ